MTTKTYSGGPICGWAAQEIDGYVVCIASNSKERRVYATVWPTPVPLNRDGFVDVAYDMRCGMHVGDDAPSKYTGTFPSPAYDLPSSVLAAARQMIDSERSRTGIASRDGAVVVCEAGSEASKQPGAKIIA